MNSRFYVILSLLASVLLVPSSLSAANTVENIRFGITPDAVRVVLDTDSPLDYKAFVLGSPTRVVIDLPAVTFNVTPPKTHKQKGFISAYRYGAFQPSVSRLVLDANTLVVIDRIFRLPPDSTKALPHRLVIDLKKATTDTFNRARKKGALTSNEALLQQLRPPPLPPLPAKRRPLKPQEKPLVMIDPGHGGVDTGAISVNGYAEKDINLRTAKMLRRELLKSGRVRVAMTRTTDVFVSLAQRVHLARKKNADLFISIHADSHPKHFVKGFSLYTLSETASDKEAAALAKRENKADIIAGVDFNQKHPEVAHILIDLTQRETMNYALRFSDFILQEVRGVAIPLQRPQRAAGFAVLKAPDVPSVLMELGYLSNKHDEKKLRNVQYLHRMAQAIAKAIIAYTTWQQRRT
ncbi:MAG: N-acetylmuramoyl-L-alanine amidase [Alphaproteobacteria bacterium GM202ARS2]|nr:N-acetylmuramoyl-L-alanine amidase [Alphaproteobacteria bacterium GM202ARS2]